MKKRKKKSEYFGNDVEEAIIRYNNTEDHKQRERIFTVVIYPVLVELVQNLLYNAIKKGNPYKSDIPHEDLRHETVVFLYEKLSAFDPERGKAFSFFNHIAMKYLLAHAQKAYRKMVERVDIEYIDLQRDLDNEITLETQRRELKDFVKVWSKNCNNRLHVLFEKEKEQRVANAIFNLFENLELIDIYDKKALYILIKEQISDVNTYHITTVMAEIKKLFENNYKYHLNQREEIEDDGFQEETI